MAMYSRDGNGPLAKKVEWDYEFGAIWIDGKLLPNADGYGGSDGRFIGHITALIDWIDDA
jgi:hypothetical protein